MKMTRRAFFMAGDRIVHIANPCGAGLPYQAQPHVVAPGEQVGPQRQEQAETMILVERGVLEVMVNGLAATVAAGCHVRIPAGTWFAYRNDGSGAAHILCRTAPVPPMRQGCRITIRIEAA